MNIDLASLFTQVGGERWRDFLFLGGAFAIVALALGALTVVLYLVLRDIRR